MSTPRNELPVLEGMKGSLLREPPKNREDEIRLSLMGLAALFSYLGFWRSFLPIDFVAIGATLVGGYPVFVETFHSLRHRSINMEVSMTVAIVASLLVGQFTAAVVITFFVLLSEFIEAYAVDKGRATIVKLERSIPRRALVRRDGKEIETAVESIRPGETVIVRDGERIPVDGNLVKGSGFVNQSAITGEAVAVEKLVGSRVFAGSVDQSGVFEVRTEKVGNETVFGQIIRLVEEAESRKAPIQRISDKLAALACRVYNCLCCDYFCRDPEPHLNHIGNCCCWCVWCRCRHASSDCSRNGRLGKERCHCERRGLRPGDEQGRYCRDRQDRNADAR